MNSKKTKTNEDHSEILMEWKKLYNEALIDALKPSGSILQIGFGSGAAAQRIQKSRPKHHTIIEKDAKRFEELKKWASKNPGITLIHDEWEKALPKLGTFDEVFFDNDSEEHDVEIMNYLLTEDTLQVSQQAQKLLNDLEKQMAKMKVKFTDKDIEDFYKKNGRSNLNELPKFFHKLMNNGNITKAQYDNAVKKYQLQELEKGRDKNTPQGAGNQSNKLLICLEECLKKHMNKGAVFSASLSNQISKYEDSQFFDKIITNPNIDYTESSVEIKLSDKTRPALIMRVEKKA